MCVCVCTYILKGLAATWIATSTCINIQDCTHTLYTTVRRRLLRHPDVCASSWMDRKIVTVMSTTTQPDVGTVLRRQKDGSRISVPCPYRSWSTIAWEESTGVIKFEANTAPEPNVESSTVYISLPARRCHHQRIHELIGESTKSWSWIRCGSFSLSPSLSNNHPRGKSQQEGQAQEVTML